MLHGDLAGAFRLRAGDYRVLFTLENDTIRIFGVRQAVKSIDDEATCGPAATLAFT